MVWSPVSLSAGKADTSRGETLAFSGEVAICFLIKLIRVSVTKAISSSMATFAPVRSEVVKEPMARAAPRRGAESRAVVLAVQARQPAPQLAYGRSRAAARVVAQARARAVRQV